jgi:hypothetical protein
VRGSQEFEQRLVRETELFSRRSFKLPSAQVSTDEPSCVQKWGGVAVIHEEGLPSVIALKRNLVQRQQNVLLYL